jgi:hypothetical protein
MPLPLALPVLPVCVRVCVCTYMHRELTLESVSMPGSANKFIRVQQLPAADREARDEAQRQAAEVGHRAPAT